MNLLLLLLSIVLFFYFIFKRFLKEKTSLGKTLAIVDFIGIVIIIIMSFFIDEPIIVGVLVTIIFSIGWTILIALVYFFIKLFKKSKKLCIIILSSLILVLALIYLLYRANKYNNPNEISTSSVLFGNYSSLLSDKKAYYFIPNTSSGKLYYTDESFNKKLVCNNLKPDNYDIVKFSFIDNNDIYYDTGYDFNKINIDNCEVTDLLSDYRFIIKVGDYAYLHNGEKEVVKYDYKNKKIVDKKTIDINYNYSDVIIDYDNFDFYYVASNGFEKYMAMKNDEILFESDIKLDVLSLSNNIVLFTDELFIYKYDLKTKSVVDTIDKPFKNSFAIHSDNGDNYFILDHQYIYKYDSVVDDLIEITKIETTYLFDIYHVNDKVIFAGDEVYVYDLLTNETTRYDKVGSYTKNDNDFELSSVDNFNAKIIVIR